MKALKSLVVVGCIVAALSTASAGTITVTSPVNNDFLGRSNQLRFTITGSRAQARVTARITSIANPNFVIERFNRFDPNVDGEIQGSLDLNFSDTTPEGNYRIVVTVSEPSNTYNQVTIDPVSVDVRNPKFRDFSPNSGAFIRNVVPIRVLVDEPNIEEWRVQVNGQDIPNNTGSTQDILVNWSAQDITNDGNQNISIRVEDRAGNSNSRNVAVTLDRIAPSINILSPTPSTFRPGASIPVSIDFIDQFANSVTLANVDIEMRSMSGQYMGRVARRSARVSGNNLQWTGRIRTNRNTPKQFKIVVRAVDRAGNPATVQEAIVNLR